MQDCVSKWGCLQGLQRISGDCPLLLWPGHSFYGLQTAELPAPLVMQRSLERNDIVNQIQSVDVLIWDEISMSSLRIFHIVDQLHQKVRSYSLPFGGIQVILVRYSSTSNKGLVFWFEVNCRAN